MQICTDSDKFKFAIFFFLFRRRYGMERQSSDAVLYHVSKHTHGDP